MRYPTRFPEERLRFSLDPSLAKQFLRFKAWADPFSSTEKKKEKKRNIDPGGDLCSFVKNTGTRGRENTTRFFMAYLILRSIFGVKIFSLVAVRVDFSCSFFFFFFFIFILRYISREIANNFRRGEQL